MHEDSVDSIASPPSGDSAPDDALARYIVALTIEGLEHPGAPQSGGAPIAIWNLLRLLDDYRYDAARFEPPWPAGVAAALDRACRAAFENPVDRRMACRSLATTLYQLRLQRVVVEPFRTQAMRFFRTLAESI